MFQSENLRDCSNKGTSHFANHWRLQAGAAGTSPPMGPNSFVFAHVLAYNAAANKEYVHFKEHKISKWKRMFSFNGITWPQSSQYKFWIILKSCVLEKGTLSLFSHWNSLTDPNVANLAKQINIVCSVRLTICWITLILLQWGINYHQRILWRILPMSRKLHP